MLENNSINFRRILKQGVFCLQIPENKFQDQVLPSVENKC